MTSPHPKTDRESKQLKAENLRLRAENLELRDRINALSAAIDARQSEQQSALQAEVQRLREELAVALDGLKKLRESKRAGEKVSRADKLAVQSKIQKLRDELNETLGVLKELKRLHFGRSSERSGKKPRKKSPRRPNDEDAQRKREEARKERSNIEPEPDEHNLTKEQRCTCSKCGGKNIKKAPSETSTEYEWEPGRLRRIEHQMERAVCRDCGAFAQAPSPTRVVDGGLYGPGFLAHLVVAKILDCVPLYRQARALARQGLFVSRSTLTDQFHQVASIIEPIYKLMIEQVPDSRVVYADETRLKMQRVKQLAYIWTFATSLFVTYVFSPSRSGKTATKVLGESRGVLVVDGYTGYNQVTTPQGRARAGCNAHCRRKFKNSGDEEAQEVVELYKEVFAVEREAKECGVEGSEEHLAMRKARAGPAMEAIKSWCDEHRDDYLPKGPVGKAITYLTNQWDYLTVFLDDVEVAPDNNLSERLLRIIALGRKNYLFVGNEVAGRNRRLSRRTPPRRGARRAARWTRAGNLAMLASVIATCVLHNVNPETYLKDVLLRVQTHPNARLEELLPHRWKQLFAPNIVTTKPPAASEP